MSSLKSRLAELLLAYSKSEDDTYYIKDFAESWPGNFILQNVATTTPLETVLQSTAGKIDLSIYNVGRFPDSILIDLISNMRVLHFLLFIYNNETNLMERYCNQNRADFRNAILWTSDILERHLILQYNIPKT